MVSVDTGLLYTSIEALPLLDADRLRMIRNSAMIPLRDATPLLEELVRHEWLTLYQAGKLLHGRGSELLIGGFLLLEKIGEGGMGKVYRARQLNLDRIVALKVVRRDLLANPKVLQRFHREARMAAALDHPNIVRLYDADRVDGNYFLSMEFVRGSDLNQVIRSLGSLPVQQTVRFVMQIAAGLQHAHERGLVHRDIKPSNLFVTEPEDSGKTAKRTQPTVRILDMGLARVAAGLDDEGVSQVTISGMVVGTPDFMSPEQARNSSSVDARADLYSLGCTFHYMLTGGPIFPGGTPIEKMLRHQIEAPIPTVSYRPDLPSGIGSIIDKLLSKEPRDRYQTAGELIAALDPWTRAKLLPTVVLRTPDADAKAIPVRRDVALDALPKDGVSPFDFESRSLPTVRSNPDAKPYVRVGPPVSVQILFVAGVAALALILMSIVVRMVGRGTEWGVRPSFVVGFSREEPSLTGGRQIPGGQLPPGVFTPGY